MRSFVIAILSLAFRASVANAEEPSREVRGHFVPVPDSSYVSTRPADLERIRGTWKSRAFPAARITIAASSSRTVEVRALGRFVASGFLDGDDFIGMSRTQLGRVAFEVLRFRVTDVGRIQATFSTLTGAPLRGDVWTSAQYRPTRAQRELDSLPRLDEFVYLDEYPEVIVTTAPVYPAEARRKNIGGVVLVHALVGKDGRVKDARVARGIPALDASAVTAVKQWRFRPGTSKGQHVAAWIVVPVRFKS